MENVLNPLLPAFNLLWKAALKENRMRVLPGLEGNGHFEVPKQPTFLQGVKVNSPKLQNQIILSNDTNASNANTSNDESVVVCTLECDHGSKFVRQIIHEGTQKSEWSRAEDLFVDWLNCELTSQRAQRIDVTIYFCHIPVNTCSHGLCLWLQNLRDEGKEVNVKIKIASLGALVSRYLNGDSPATQHGNYEHHETQETIGALRKMTKMAVVVEPLSAGDWMQLVSLLTDRASLEALDLQQSPSAERLAKILQTTL